MTGDYFKGDLVRHETLGLGRVEETSSFGEGQKLLVYFPRSEKSSWLPKANVTMLSEAEAAAYEMVKLAIKELRREEAPAIDLANKWVGGQLVVKSGDETVAPYAMPVDTFFHKIVMVRDRLRVMEQHINASPKLTDEEKVNLQQYITRIYGSLTSFNVLFKNKQDHFVGQKS